MGAVFAAISADHPGEVALKIIDPTRSGTAKARLLTEARAAAAIRHPNLVRCLDIGESCDLPYLVMDLIDGGSAAGLLAQGAVPETVMLDIARDMAAALGALHAAGVLHRDIKPANILRHPCGSWLLADFGLARVLDGLPGVTIGGYTVGTPDYMGPEQATASDLDARADLYGLGATLYHLATGTTPYTGGTVWEILRQVINDPFPDPLALRPGMSAHLAAIINKLGAKRPEERYSSAQQVTDDLALVREGRAPVHAHYRSSEELLVGTSVAGPRVLLIDDDPLARGLFSAVLKKRGWRVQVSEDGLRGLGAAGQTDVAVVDLVLPDITGVEVVERIRHMWPTLPVVVLTNAFTQTQLNEARRAGACDVLNKATTSPSSLADILAHLVSRKPVVHSPVGEGQPNLVAAVDAAVARLQLLSSRLSEPAPESGLLDDLASVARGLALAATDTARPAAAVLAASIEELARQLIASPEQVTESTRCTLHRAVLALRPLLVGCEAMARTAQALVVDDDPTSRLLASRALAKAGISFVAVDSPRAALAHLRSQPCDLLLTDVVMDGGSGFQLAAQARQILGKQRLPIIFVTSLNDFAQFFDAKTSANSDMLCKPYLLIELSTKCLVLLARTTQDAVT